MHRPLLALLALVVPLAAQPDPRLAFTAGRVNLAAGLPVTLAPAANYGLTAKGGTDANDLTDGVLTDRQDEALWFDSKAVGYQFNPFLRWKVDLGRVAPVDEVAARFLGGAAQGAILFPGRVAVLLSDDGRQWHRVAWFIKDTASMTAAGLPPEEGTAWTRPLRFAGLRSRGRYVGLEIVAGGSLTAADELFVFAGGHDRGAVRFADPGTSFETEGVFLYLEKPVYRFSRNVATYGSLGCVDNRPAAQRRTPIKVIVRMPAGTRLAAGDLGGYRIYSERSDSRPAADYQPPVRRVPAGGGEEIEFVTKAYDERSWAKVFVTGEVARDGPCGTMAISVEWDQQSTTSEFGLEAITIPAAPMPRRLMTNMGWVSLDTARLWPDFLDAYGRLGFNAVPVFARWHDPAKPEEQATYAFLDRCRQAGYQILDMESPIHDLLNRAKDKPEVWIQDQDGKPTNRFNPAYRGPLYQQAVAALPERWAPTRATQIFFDIEWWNWRGPFDCEQDPLCQHRKQELGIADWDEFRKVMGREMMTDLVGAYRKKAAEIGLDPQQLVFGGYDFEAGKAYQNVWDFDRLYPDLLAVAQPSWYSPLSDYNLVKIREALRENRAQLPANDIVPWLTPGDSGEFDSRRLVWALSELLVNGARGFTWWSGRTWDPDDFRAVARVATMFAPYEDLVVEGTPCPPLATTGPGQAFATVKDGRALVLVAAYGTTGPAKTIVTLPPAVAGRVTDLDNRQDAGQVATGGSFEVVFDDERCRVFAVGE